MNTLVISGGGLQGLSFIGCLQYLDEIGAIDGIRNFVGTSIGSLICFLLTLGYNIDQIRSTIRKSFLQENDLDKDKQTCHSIPTDETDNMIISPPTCPKKKILECVTTGGLESDTRIMSLIEFALDQRFGFNREKIISFRDLAMMTGYNLVITGSNITDATVDLFCMDLTPDMSVTLALRISMAMPLVFSPVWYKGKMYTDGAVFQNFPISFFESFPRIFSRNSQNVDRQKENHEDGSCTYFDTIGIVLKTPHITTSRENDYNVMTVMQDMCQAMYRRLNTEHDILPNELRISVTFDDMDAWGGYDLTTLDFCCIDRILFNALIQMGYACALDTYTAKKYKSVDYSII